MRQRPPSSPTSSPAPQAATTGLVGIGLDNSDGHKRITKGDQFVLVGGSAETHERMAETTIKTFEELKRRDKRLETVEPRELAEILSRSTPR
ncbi:MAG: hypothetical protein EAZ36_02725 [Verrucomicrobia bacterium]|nr:MAG: hypothetical protein EAZ36_02725 [Verrucomicrobiota bacterium]